MTTGNTHNESRNAAPKRGWTLVELLVVIAILSVLGVISVPIFRMFGRNDLRDSARTIYTMLRAARIYAMTNNVETAVVYRLDDDSYLYGPYYPDTILQANVRAIKSATLMYRLPDEVAARVPPAPPDPLTREDIGWDARNTSTFVPVPRYAGEFATLRPGYAVLLIDPDTGPDGVIRPEDTLEPLLYTYDPDALDADAYFFNYNPGMERGYPISPELDRLGMHPVYAYPGIIERVGDDFFYAPDLIRPFMAHVFTPRGELRTRNQRKERFRILVAPDPWQNPEDRLIEFAGESYQLIGLPIEIQRATGRVRMEQ